MNLVNLANKTVIKLIVFLGIIVAAVSSFAELNQETDSSITPNKPSELIKKLKTHTAKNSGEIQKNSVAAATESVSAPKKSARSKLKTAKTSQKKSKTIKTNANLATTEPIIVKAPKKNWLSEMLHKIYVRADYGAAKNKTITQGAKVKIASMYGGGIGYKFNQAFSADINMQFRKLKTKKSAILEQINFSSIFLNTYLHLMDEDNYVIPFITAGIGYSQNDVKNTTIIVNPMVSTVVKNRKGRNVAWNLGAGARLKLTNNISIAASYKYIDFGKAKWYSTYTVGGNVTTVAYKKRIKMHQISGGLIFNF